MSTRFAKTLSRLAGERGLGYEKLANLTDLSPVFIWRLMDGQKNPSYVTVYRLAKALAKVEPTAGTQEPTVGENYLLGKLLMAAVNDAVAKAEAA